MALTRLRTNNISGAASVAASASVNPITLSTPSATTATWTYGVTGLPTVASPNYAVVVVEPNTSNEEIIYVTAFTSGQNTATVVRAQEGTTGITHTATAWQHGPTAYDFVATPDQLNSGTYPSGPVVNVSAAMMGFR